MTTTVKRRYQRDDESAMDYLRRVVKYLELERRSILDIMPSVEAVMEYFELLYYYDTDCWEGVVEAIADNEDADKAVQFVNRNKLPAAWTCDISNAIGLRK